MINRVIPLSLQARVGLCLSFLFASLCLYIPILVCRCNTYVTPRICRQVRTGVPCRNRVHKTLLMVNSRKRKHRMNRTNLTIHQLIPQVYGIASSCVVCDGYEGKRLQKRLHSMDLQWSTHLVEFQSQGWVAA